MVVEAGVVVKTLEVAEGTCSVVYLTFVKSS